MSALDKLFKEYDNRQAKTVKIREEVAEINAKIIAHKKNAEEAAAAGDVDGYKAEFARVQDISCDKYVKEKVITELQKPIETAVITQALQEHLESVAADFRKKKETYVKALQKLADAFNDIAQVCLDLQGLADKCREVAGQPKHGADIDNVLLKYPLMTHDDFAADIRYFIGKGMLTQEEASSIDCAMR